jgi:hypothetical protein
MIFRSHAIENLSFRPVNNHIITKFIVIKLNYCESNENSEHESNNWGKLKQIPKFYSKGKVK